MARIWASGPRDTRKDIDTIVEQMRRYGAPQAQINRYLQQHQAEPFYLLRENVSVWLWFTEVDDLFVTANNVVLGLDVTAIEADTRMQGKERSPEDYRKLRIIGREAARQLNQRGKKQ